MESTQTDLEKRLSHMEKLLEQISASQSTPQLKILTKQQLAERLDISIPTLNKYTEQGLKRVQAPLTDSRRVWYNIDDVHKFFGIEG